MGTFLNDLLIIRIEFTEESSLLLLGELAPGTIVGSETCRNCKGKKNPRVVHENMSEIVF